MKSKTILLADDDSDVLESTQYLLMEEGFNVITATNGKQATEQYKEFNPDVVFMDIKMPVLNGYDAFYQIKEFDKNAKIILTSSYAIDDEQFQKAKNNTLSDLLNKPFKLQTMVHMIEKHSR